MHNMPHVCDIYAIQCAASNMNAVALAALCEEYFEDMKALGVLEPDVVTLGSL